MQGCLSEKRLFSHERLGCLRPMLSRQPAKSLLRMLPPLAQNAKATPISEPPATTPDATGKGELCGELRFAFLEYKRNERAQKEQKPIVPVEHPRPNAAARADAVRNAPSS